MKYQAQINVMPLPSLPNNRAKSLIHQLDSLGIKDVQDIIFGKHIEMEIEADSEEKAKELVEEACKKLLANTIIETFTYKLKPI